MGVFYMKKYLALFFLVFLLTSVSSWNVTKQDELCTQVFNFILDHYNPTDNKLEFTDDDFDLLQMQTTALPADLKNHIIYYEDLCGEDLPFLDYNNEWPNGEVKEIKDDKQSMKEGFSKFLNVAKQDSKKILLVIVFIIIVFFFANKYL